MPVIGVTGSIAGGKSLVTSFLAELGAKVIDADIIAREVVKPGTQVWKEISNIFGRSILNSDQTINRKALGAIVFNNTEERAKLNRITHPAIIDKVRTEVKEFEKKEQGKNKLLVVVAPLLIETGLCNEVDEVWLVYVPEKVQIQRLMCRDKITREEAVKKIRSQMPLEEKKKYAHVIIDNSGEMALTRKTVEALVMSRSDIIGG
jgi:dephospho-CoA kinase